MKITNSRIVAHDGNGCQFLKSQVVRSLDLLAIMEQITNRFISGSGDLKFIKFLLILESKHLADGHHVGGQGTGLVGANDGGATQGLNGRQGPDDCVLLGHPAGSQCQASGDDSGQTLRDGGDSQSNGDLEVVDGTLDPGSTMSGIVEVANVDSPDGDANQGDDLGQLFTEFVQLLLQRSLDLFGLSHFGPDPANGGVQAGANDDSASLAGGDVGAGEDDVLLVLVDGPGVGDRLVVFDHGYGFTGQDGLVNTESCGQDGDDPDICGDLVTDYKKQQENKSSIGNFQTSASSICVSFKFHFLEQLISVENEQRNEL